MKVEVLCNLKSGQQFWKRGTVFDDAVSPIPKDILAEVKARSKSVMVLFEDFEPKSFEEEIAVEIPKTAVIRTITETELPKSENPPEFFPELERLIEMQGSMAGVARLFDVTYVTVSRWRKAMPRPEVVDRIKKEYARLTHDQNRVDDAASAGA
jgi:hypothetical protein